MEFLYPNFLIIIPSFLVLVILKNFFYKKSSSIQVSNFSSLKNFFGYQGRVKVFLINALFIIALISIIVGLARPQISSINKDITVEVIDIVLVLDTSSSMLAEDFKPNRLEAVKEAAKEFIKNRDGDRIGLLVFGKDWPTPDGTCIRDFIHVMDLAEAHIATLNYLKNNKPQNISINIGTGKGTSVIEAIETFQKIKDIDFEYKFVERRLGDQSFVVADNKLALDLLKWTPKRNLLDMCKDSLIY